VLGAGSKAAAGAAGVPRRNLDAPDNADYLVCCAFCAKNVDGVGGIYGSPVQGDRVRGAVPSLEAIMPRSTTPPVELRSSGKQMLDRAAGGELLVPGAGILIGRKHARIGAGVENRGRRGRRRGVVGIFFVYDRCLKNERSSFAWLL